VARRRRAVAAVLAGGLLLALRPVVLPGGDPLGVPGQATAAASARSHVYTVRPGDTLWSIARQMRPQADPRPLVDQLAAQVHGATLQVGERIVLP
jgi:LysM repeat protein